MPHDVNIFPWNSNFETGMAIIDRQHKQLVHLINKLALQAAASDNINILESIFLELADYVEYHFRTEEKIMLKYLDKDQTSVMHLQEHHDFEDQILALKSQLGTTSLAKVLEDALSFLVHWLAEHILDTDTRMVKTILFMQQGLPVTKAKELADKEMLGSAKILIDTILIMYDDLTHKTLMLMKEIISRQKAQQQLQLAGKVMASTLESIFISDEERIILDMNPSFCNILKKDLKEVLGKNVCTLHPALHENADVWAAVKSLGHWVGETSYTNSSGNIVNEWLNLSAVKDDDGKTSNYVGVFSNVSQLIDSHKDLYHVANHDALTALPNRMLLLDRLQQDLNRSQRNKDEILAVLFIDLDGFKTVNDTFGHDAGDEVLIQVAHRFTACIRTADTVARLGGDEFVIILPNLKSKEECLPTLKRLQQAFSEPIMFHDQPLNVTLSIGVAISPDNADNATKLILLADQAMYQAKRLGKNQYHIC